MRRSGKSFLMNELFYRILIRRGISEGQIIRFAFDMDEDIDLLEPCFPDEPTRVLNERNLPWEQCLRGWQDATKTRQNAAKRARVL